MAFCVLIFFSFFLFCDMEDLVMGGGGREASAEAGHKCRWGGQARKMHERGDPEGHREKQERPGDALMRDAEARGRYGEQSTEMETDTEKATQMRK